MTLARPILYFGCIGDKGHYLWCRINGECAPIKMADRLIPGASPWDHDIDGGIWAKSPRIRMAGVIHTQQKGNWTAVGWADYSVDNRPGSHSLFLINDLISSGQLIDLARVQWPEVFGRKGFPVLT